MPVSLAELLGDRRLPPSSDEQEALDALTNDCGGDLRAVALTLFRLLEIVRTTGAAETEGRAVLPRGPST